MISSRRSLNHWGKLGIACRWVIAVFLSTSASLSVFTQASAASTEAAAPIRVAQAPEAAVTGMVFNDANANGKRDANELGIFGVSVAAFIGNATVPAATTTTDANGNYALTVSATRARVEFTGWSAQLQSSFFGPNSGTSVQLIMADCGSCPSAYGVSFRFLHWRE